MTNKKLLVFASAIAIAVVAFLVLSNRPTKGKQFKLAANLPLTGDLAVYGISIKRGAELALDDFRLEEPGYDKFVMDWQDNASEPKTAVAVMQRQLASNPDLYVSGIRPQTVAIWDQVVAAKVPHVVWIFDRTINPEGQHRNNIRTWVNLKDEARVYLAYVDKVQAKKVAILHTQSPLYQDEFEGAVIPGLKERGVDFYRETYPFEGADYRTISLKVKAYEPDLIILNGWQSHLIGLIRSIRSLNLVSNGNVVATYDLLDAAEVLGRDELDGISFVAPSFLTRSDEAKVVSWTAKFERKYRVSPLYTDAYAYDMMRVIRNAVARLPENPSHSDWLEALQSTKIDGVTGSIEFDEDGSLVAEVEVATFRDGKIVPFLKNVPVGAVK